MLFDPFFDGVGRVPTGLIPDHQDLPLDLPEQCCEEGLGVVGASFLMRFGDNSPAFNIERPVEGKLTVFFGTSTLRCSPYGIHALRNGGKRRSSVSSSNSTAPSGPASSIARSTSAMRSS